jgi:hypothetical protein
VPSTSTKPVVRRVEPEKRRAIVDLPDPTGPEQRDVLAGLDREADLVERLLGSAG